MLIIKRIIEVEIPNNEFDKLSEDGQLKIEERIEDLIVDAIDGLETDFGCVFTNNPTTVKLKIREF